MIVDESPNSPKDGEMSRLAVKLFFGIAEEWGLTDEQFRIVAGIDTLTTLQDWRQKLDSSEPVIDLPSVEPSELTRRL